MVLGSETSMRLIEHGQFKLIIMDAPSERNSPQYVTELKNYGVTDVVRTCEPTYSPESFELAGIHVHEMTFLDGAPPPDDLVQKWYELVCQRYKSKNPADLGVIAVHCVAGLGRAPVMAAVALIEMTAMDPMDAVEKIRAKQKGAINAKQLKFLQDYKRQGYNGMYRGGGRCGCSLM
mmetsp:Transcript_55362/g.171782  ORF Transcript_55362/g.171782 Transcript_55362/m.171782 type:complete len:177 (-) Transcript_55362:284-814(-)